MNTKEFVVYPVHRSGWKYVTKINDGRLFKSEAEANSFLTEMKDRDKANTNVFWNISSVNRGDC